MPVPQADSATADQGSDGGVSSAATNGLYPGNTNLLFSPSRADFLSNAHVGDRVGQPILGLEDAVAQGLLFQPIDVNAAVAATPSPDEDKDYTMVCYPPFYIRIPSALSLPNLTNPPRQKNQQN